jgi:hypothetical protein
VNKKKQKNFIRLPVGGEVLLLARDGSFFASFFSKKEVLPS